MSVVKKVVMLLMQWTFIFVFGMKALLPLLWSVVTKGPKQTFYVKRREERPEVLDDPDLGTHKFARLKVSYIPYLY